MHYDMSAGHWAYGKSKIAPKERQSLGRYGARSA